jgi:hypothetical protein
MLLYAESGLGDSLPAGPIALQQKSPSPARRGVGERLVANLMLGNAVQS